MTTTWQSRIVEHGEVDPRLLIPHPKNWKIHPAFQRAVMGDALSEVGWLQTVVVNRPTGNIIDGHMRVQLAIEGGEPTIPVTYVDLSAHDEAKALALFDPVGALAREHNPIMEELIRQVDTDSINIRRMLDAYGQPALKAGQTDPDDVPTATRRIVQPGDVWQLGEHLLLCGSCEQLGSVVPPETATLLVTDPPYGVSYGDKNAFLNAIAPGNRIQEPIEGDHQTPDEMSVLWRATFGAIRCLLAPGAAYYVTGPQGGDLLLLLLLLLLLALRDSGFPLRHMLVWVKNGHVLGRSDYHYQHEPILYGWVDGGAHHAVADRSETSTWFIPKPQVSELHPTMKPVALWARAIQNSSDEGGTIVDPFLGSGTAFIAAEQTHRRCVGAEISPVYCDVSIQRWQSFTGQVATRVAHGG